MAVHMFANGTADIYGGIRGFLLIIARVRLKNLEDKRDPLFIDGEKQYMKKMRGNRFIALCLLLVPWQFVVLTFISFLV